MFSVLARIHRLDPGDLDGLRLLDRAARWKLSRMAGAVGAGSRASQGLSQLLARLRSRGHGMSGLPQDRFEPSKEPVLQRRYAVEVPGQVRFDAVLHSKDGTEVH